MIEDPVQLSLSKVVRKSKEVSMIHKAYNDVRCILSWLNDALIAALEQLGHENNELVLTSDAMNLD